MADDRINFFGLAEDKLYYDEKKNPSQVIEEIEVEIGTDEGPQKMRAKQYRTEDHEHCPVLTALGEYIKTLNLPDGKGKTLADDLVETAREHDCLDSVKLLGSDTCPKMKGECCTFQ